MIKKSAILVALISAVALSACSSGSNEPLKTNPGSSSSVKSSDTVTYTGKVDDDKKPYELGGDQLSNKELESFLKNKM